MCEFLFGMAGTVLGGICSIIATLVAQSHQTKLQKELIVENQMEEKRIWLRNKRENLFKTICGALREFSKVELNVSSEEYEKNPQVVYINQDLIKNHIQTLSFILKENRDEITMYLPSKLRSELIKFDGFVAKIIKESNELLIKDIPQSSIIEMVKKSERLIDEFRAVMGIND